MKKFEENDLVEYIGELATIRCNIDGTDTCYLLEFNTESNLYCLIAQEKDIKLIAKNACNKVFKEKDKVITLKGKGVIDSIDYINEKVMYGISMEDGIHYFFKGEVWEDTE